MIEDIATALVSNALVLAALTYLAKTFLGHQLQKDLTDFKHQLQLTSDREKESYKSALEIDRLRLQISYGGIFEKQADAILRIYEAMLQLEKGTSEAVHFGGEVSERRKRFADPWFELLRVYETSRILLPEDVDMAVSGFMDRMRSGAIGYISAEARDWTRVREKEAEKLYERQDKAMEIINDEAPALREELIKKMRAVIGVVADEL